jgi:hypothetical protein
MKSKIIFKFFIATLLCLSLAGGLSAKQDEPKKQEVRPQQQEDQPQEEKGKKAKALPKIKEDWKAPPPSPSFYIGRIENQPFEFSILLSDENKRNVFYMLNLNRLLLVEAVVHEAQRFAETEEAVGTSKPQITRFVDKQEPAFIVDVSKLNRESRIYITLEGANGRLTVNAAKIIRGDKEKSDIRLLTKIYELMEKAKTDTQPQ